MYLFERFFGLFVFLTTLVLITIHISHSNTKKVKKTLIIYLLLLVIMGYLYKPSYQADLYRILNSLETYYSFMPFDSVKDKILTSATPSAVILYFAFSKFNWPHLLPAFAAAVYYGCFFYIIYKTSIKYNISSKLVAKGLFFFMISGQFIEAVSNIRFPLAMALISFCIFRETIEGKKGIINLFIYLFAGLLHQAALFLVVFRVAYLLFQKSRSVFDAVIKLIICVIAFLLLIRYGGFYLTSLFDKASNYIENKVYSYIWEYIIAWICVTFVIINFMFYNNKVKKVNVVESKNHKSIEINNYSRFVIFVLVISVIFCFEYSIFHRFVMLLNFLFIPLYMIALSDMYSRKVNTRNYNLIIFALKCILFVLVFSRGNLSALKFFVID